MRNADLYIPRITHVLHACGHALICRKVKFPVAWLKAGGVMAGTTRGQVLCLHVRGSAEFTQVRAAHFGEAL